MISAYMRDDVTIKTTAYGTWGNPTYTETDIKGYFIQKTKLVRNTAGEEVVSSANVILPVMTLGHQDRIVYNSKEYAILNIELKKDFSNRFLLIYLA